MISKDAVMRSLCNYNCRRLAVGLLLCALLNRKTDAMLNCIEFFHRRRKPLQVTRTQDRDHVHFLGLPVLSGNRAGDIQLGKQSDQVIANQWVGVTASGE